MNNPGTLSQLIHRIRGRRVMLSFDLAKLYHVAPKALIQAVNRNCDRFPGDFLFQLDQHEARALRESSGALIWGSFAKYPPYAFTEQGVAMLSSVLKSKTAIHANILIMRAFVRMRELGAEHRDILKKLDDLGLRVDKHDVEIGELIDAIREDILPPGKSRRQIGFQR
ncbi:MAG: hypothetical protein A2V88_15085 [Elusimicrobia bacterium RBG_16_66_12]|nr:MAG: hypothetical protein A2V88_15085 [Elusimicrobia bacterium RBG_16_66_12]